MNMFKIKHHGLRVIETYGNQTSHESQSSSFFLIPNITDFTILMPSLPPPMIRSLSNFLQKGGFSRYVGAVLFL